MLARCVRVASPSVRHARTLYTTDLSSPPDPTKPRHQKLMNLIDRLADARPPVGTEFGPPRGPARNPLDREIIQKFSTHLPRYSLYCQSTRNNTIMTLMNNEFKLVASFSGGLCGFKKVNRSGYEAGYQCAVGMFKEIEKIVEKDNLEIDLYFKGFGQGRDAVHRALLTSEGDKVRGLVMSITDRTPIKIGGTRAKKARRL
ncbi:hypothetical protein C0995_000910 [Termitomyces sp. Mi166|nr:hypothetical protein C0995_000910 [Termitomyces sp. Mi166\